MFIISNCTCSTLSNEKWLVYVTSCSVSAWPSKNFDWKFDRDHTPKWILHPFVMLYLHLRESARRVITEAREGCRPYEKQSLLPTFISGGMPRRTKAESHRAAKYVSNIKKKGSELFFCCVLFLIAQDCFALVCQFVPQRDNKNRKSEGSLLLLGYVKLVMLLQNQR